MSNSERNPTLNPDEILIAEYEYIAQTVFQANEDRARVTSFYFVTVGSLIAAILGTQFMGDSLTLFSLAFGIFFTVLTGLGALTIAQLARLRAAWHESVQAMNTIKDFYLKHHPEYETAFKWRMKSIPPTDKPFSIANLMTVEVALLSGLTTGAAAFFFLQFLMVTEWWGWLITALLVIFGYFANWKWYKFLLKDKQ
jgi:hypothetical protein